MLSSSSLAALTERPAAPVSVGDASYYGMGLLVRPISGTSPSGANWWHDGSLPGTETYAVRLSNGWSWAVFFNTRPADSDTFASDIDSSINATLAAITPPATGDLFATSAPDFATQPISRTVAAGDSVTLAPTMSSLTSSTYQWFKDGEAIVGATGSTLTIGTFAAGNVGAYSLVATNIAGSATTLPAVLQLVSGTDSGRLINLSCRAQTGTGANILIAGFVVGGAGTTGTKQMLVRASGPALQQFGITGTLPDPQLQLFDASGQVLAANTGWGGSPQVIAVASAVAAFAWPSASSADSALLFSQHSGNFTAQIAGANGDTGISLVEVYDATPSSVYTLSTPRLINLSARAPVGTGSDILIAGFVIGGSAPKTLLVRAIGPTLGQLNVTGTLSDPKLEIYSGSTLIRSNDDWGGGLALGAAFSAVGAFSLPASSKDAALLVTLAPGAYTAQVSGGGATLLA